MSEEKEIMTPQDNLNAIRNRVDQLAHQIQDNAEGLKKLHKEQQKQTNYLKEINRVIQLMGILILLSLAAGCCVAIGGSTIFTSGL